MDVPHGGANLRVGRRAANNLPPPDGRRGAVPSVVSRTCAIWRAVTAFPAESAQTKPTCNRTSDQVPAEALRNFGFPAQAPLWRPARGFLSRMPTSPLASVPGGGKRCFGKTQAVEGNDAGSVVDATVKKLLQGREKERRN
jgi:hypothetical protein